MKTERRGLDVAAAIAGPVFAVGAVVWAVRAGTRSRFLYFADTTTAALVNFWLAISLVRQLWDGSGSRTYLPRWLEAEPQSAAARVEAVSRRFSFLMVLAIAGVALAASLLRVPLLAPGAIVVAIVLASLALAFELCGWWIASVPARARRVVRGVFAVLVGVAVAAWAIEARSQGLFAGRADVVLPQLLTAGPWEWFYPARWTLDVVERVVNGRAFVLASLPAVACALLLAARYVRRPGRPDPGGAIAG